MIFANNITIAVLERDTGWRNDFTIRFVEHYTHSLAAADEQKILYCETVDDALRDCTTDFLLIVASGATLPERSFFTVLSDRIKQQKDIFIAKITVVDDYATLDDSCILFNMNLWREHGSIPYYSQVREGPRFINLEEGADKYEPAAITVKPNSDSAYVPPDCSRFGGGLVAKQLEVFSEASSLSRFLNFREFFFLDQKTPYFEIRTETLFEKKFLTDVSHRVFLSSNLKLSNQRATTVDIVVTPAQGLTPLNLAEHFSAKKMVVYDISPEALAFQRMIFSLEKPTLYSALVEKFLEDFPSARIMDNWAADANSVVVPLKNVDVHFYLIDACSFEMEELIESLDKNAAALFDLSDIYTYPFNFYKRPFYQVQGLFAEMFSKIKSRTGPSHLIGFAPGFISLDEMHVNTATEHFIKLWDTDRIEAPQQLNSDILEIDEEAVEPIKSRLPSWIANVAAPLRERGVEKNFVSKMTEKISSWIKDDTKTTGIQIPDQVVVPPPITAANIVQDDSKPTVAVKADSILQQKRLMHQQELAPAAREAENQGYQKNKKLELVRGIKKSVTSYTKVETLKEFTAVFEYTVDESGWWSFKVSKINGAKKVEFGSGPDDSSMHRHLLQPLKINAKSAIKFL